MSTTSEKINAALTEKVIIPNAKVNVFVMFKKLQQLNWEQVFQLNKYQYDTIIIAEEDSQHQSIKCVLGRDYKNGI